MKQDKFVALVHALRTEQDELLKLKGDEYSGSQDRLGNFKRGAELTGATPQQFCFIYLSKHYDAIATYVREGGTVPLSEPIRGRLLDLMNYCCLLQALIEEEA